MVTTKKIFFSPIRSLDCLYQYHWCQIMAMGILLKQRIFVKISLMIRVYFNHLCAIYAQKQPSYDSKESCDIKGLTSKINFNYANNKIKNFKSNFTMRWQYYNILLGTIAVWFILDFFFFIKHLHAHVNIKFTITSHMSTMMCLGIKNNNIKKNYKFNYG